MNVVEYEHRTFPGSRRHDGPTFDRYEDTGLVCNDEVSDVVQVIDHLDSDYLTAASRLTHTLSP